MDVEVKRWYPFVPVGSHTQNSSMSSAVSVTVTAGATQWMAQAQTKNVRVTFDGTTTPTASKGFQIKAGNAATIWPVVGGATIMFIEEEATAVLDYQFGRDT